MELKEEKYSLDSIQGDRCSWLSANIEYALQNFSMFQKQNDFPKQLNKNPFPLNSSLDSKLQLSQEYQPIARRVSLGSPSQTLYEAYARVSRHKPMIFQRRQEYSAWDHFDSRPKTSSLSDCKTSIYPNTPLNPELENKIRLIDNFHNSFSVSIKKPRLYSPKRKKRNVRKKSPIHINGIKCSTVAVLLLHEEMNAKCKKCRATKCNCNYINNFDNAAENAHKRNKERKQKIQKEIQECLAKSEEKLVKHNRPRSCNVRRNSSISAKKGRDLYSAERGRRLSVQTPEISITPMPIHQKK
ncbi:unnamed protein product [Blepharisma stoltei]|uniref:Uncharacterized protein n=1 Tax=Blepharisma stoltei TaxID=1481888 RepID=A0AAU9J0C4_9CILI|nr:unnamed protein product [Blepharisma stoltei]